jgi:hypothetical protein
MVKHKKKKKWREESNLGFLRVLITFRTESSSLLGKRVRITFNSSRTPTFKNSSRIMVRTWFFRTRYMCRSSPAVPRPSRGYHSTRSRSTLPIDQADAPCRWHELARRATSKSRTGSVRSRLTPPERASSRAAPLARESFNSAYALEPSPGETSEFASRAAHKSLNLVYAPLQVGVVCAMPILRGSSCRVSPRYGTT